MSYRYGYERRGWNEPSSTMGHQWSSSYDEDPRGLRRTDYRNRYNSASMRCFGTAQEAEQRYNNDPAFHSSFYPRQTEMKYRVNGSESPYFPTTAPPEMVESETSSLENSWQDHEGGGGGGSPRKIYERGFIPLHHREESSYEYRPRGRPSPPPPQPPPPKNFSFRHHTSAKPSSFTRTVQEELASQQHNRADLHWTGTSPTTTSAQKESFRNKQADPYFFEKQSSFRNKEPTFRDRSVARLPSSRSITSDDSKESSVKPADGKLWPYSAGEGKLDRKPPAQYRPHSRSMSERCLPSHRQPSLKQNHKRNHTTSSIEVTPGLYMRLRGAEETWEAIQNQFFVSNICLGCNRTILCIADAALVICPTCKTLSRVSASNHDGYDGCEEGGVGLGFKAEDL